MSTHTNTGSNESTQHQQSAQSHGNFIVFLPPPPTVWVQFNDGLQMGFSPSPAQYFQSMVNGAPLFGSTAGGDATNGNNSTAFWNALNELFQRAQEQQHGPPPTSKPFLDNLPMKMWTQHMEKTESQIECVICLSEFEKDDKVISLPCGHTFHKNCGMTWLVEHNVCPTCRYQLPAQTEPATTQTAAQTTSEATTEQESTANVTGVRRQRPTETMNPRDVRPRVDEPILISADEDTEVDHMLEQEADRFVKEEMEQRQSVATADGVEIHDCDVEELVHKKSSS